VEVRYRIDGVLQHIRNIPKALQQSVVSRIKIMADIDIAERRIPQDGRAGIRVLNRSIDLRISTLPVRYGERVVMRILDKSGKRYSIEQLGFSEQNRAAFENLITKPYGIILVTGPTGSGKSTTLYSALSHIKSTENNIITCEDPVEYELDGINQSQVNVRAGLTFATQLRSILRQDPDIVLVGEIRDAETAEIAFRAALTGHLVLSTLHANDAPNTITRLIDMGVEPFLIASSVTGIIAQRLTRVICSKCKKPYEASVDELAVLGMEPSETPVTLYRGEGCNHCDNTGYSGRVACFEVLTVNDVIRQLILSKPSVEAVKKAATEAGMTTLRQNALEKVLGGVTTVDEIRKRVYIGEDSF
jgi:type IV pilus assembly protein PilB